MSRPAPRPQRRLPLRARRNPPRWERQQPTWRQAQPALIASALKAATARPSGNWFVLAASRAIRADRTFGRTVAGQEVVAWRDAAGALHAGPGSCPHLGAPLRESPVRCGQVVCHWHGLALNGKPFAGWSPYPVHDDGVLTWVRLDEAGGEEPLPRPVLPARPAAHGATVSAVVDVEGVCEPQDVMANRLDPWHGAWFHPYAFVDLTVEDPGPDGDEHGFAVDVSFKVSRRLVVPVRAVFTAPEPRTVVMHITEGEGLGSVVETHATPLGTDDRGRPRTAVVEAVIATSERRGFRAASRSAVLLRPVMRAAAARLWRDDLDYAHRRWQLRSTGRFPG